MSAEVEITATTTDRRSVGPGATFRFQHAAPSTAPACVVWVDVTDDWQETEGRVWLSLSPVEARSLALALVAAADGAEAAAGWPP